MNDGVFCILLFMNHCSCHRITVIITVLDFWLIVLAEKVGEEEEQKRGGCKIRHFRNKSNPLPLAIRIATFRPEPVCTHTCTHCFLYCIEFELKEHMMWELQSSWYQIVIVAKKECFFPWQDTSLCRTQESWLDWVCGKAIRESLITGPFQKAPGWLYSSA